MPVKMAPSVPYLDMTTFVFCIIMVAVTLLIALNRRKFGYILNALFAPRVRSQLLRETKILGEWIYAATMFCNLLVQGMLIFLLVQFLLPDLASRFGSFALYFMALGGVLADYLVKMLMVYFLTYIFECTEDRYNFLLNKYFYQTVNSMALFPILVAAVYSGIPQFLFLYIPIFLTTYVAMIYRTLSLNSARISPFQFFLYLCTLEILPYLILAKMALMFVNQ